MARSKKSLAWCHLRWPRLDRLAWIEANRTGDYFSDGGLATELGLRTRENYELAYGRYLEFLRRTGRLTSVKRAGDRLALKDLKEFSNELSASVAPRTTLGILSAVSHAIGVMDPTMDRTSFKKVLARMALNVRPVREIDSRLIPPNELVQIGRAMMDEAEAAKCQRKMSSVVYRDGLMIMAPALCPLRRANWQCIVIGKHLVFGGDGAMLQYGARETKGRRPLALVLPNDLAQRLKRYVEHFRRGC